MANQFDGSDRTKRVLLVSNFFDTELLDLADLFELALGWPLKVIFANVILVCLKHRQLSDAFFGFLHLECLMFLH